MFGVDSLTSRSCNDSTVDPFYDTSLNENTQKRRFNLKEQNETDSETF